MTIKDARKLTEGTIQYSLRHADYAKTVEIARKSLIYVTGEGQDTEYLLPLRDKETDRQKEIRVKVTKPITPFALNPVRTEFQKIFRVDGVSTSIKGEDLEIVNEALETYHSNASLDNYFERRFVTWNFTDPNAWHITERRNKVDEFGKVEGVDVYPLEITSAQAINYGYDNGVPKWLIVEQKRMERVGDDEKMVSDFYFYAAGIALKYAEFIEEIPDVPNGELVIIEQKDTDARKFMLGTYQTGSEEFPGHKWGAYDDADGDGTLRVPPFWDGARFILDDLIETKSSFDVSRYNHVFPRLFHYDEPCDYTAKDGRMCEDGYLGGDKNATCKQCGGSGGKLHFSESDVVTFAIPKNLEDLSKLPKLADLAYYHQPPLDVTTALYDWINDFREWVYIASFNSTNIDKALVAKTATEIDKLWEDINTRVYPAASWLSRLYEKTVRVTAQYLDKKVEVRHSYPRDMKLEPLDVLLARYEAASGLPYEVRQAILFTILGKTYLDNPTKVADIKAWQYWKPFKSLTQETALFILQNRSDSDFDKLLFENWDAVQIDVAEQLGETAFSTLTIEVQKKRIEAAVERVREKVGNIEQVEPPLPDFTLAGAEN